VRYDAVFLDVDGTFLWIDLDVEGYVEDLAPYAADGSLTVEKPDPRLFEEALEASGVSRDRAVHVGNDPLTDIRVAAEAGIDTVLGDRKGDVEAPEATFVVSDMNALPDLLRD
jgi:FMN phosphatase YigB (HAD superfamily)